MRSVIYMEGVSSALWPILGGLLLLILSGCSSPREVVSSTSSPTASLEMSRIAYVSEKDDNWEIYIMNADGTQDRNLTNHPGFDSYPSWSPDGTKLAYYSDRDGNWEIYVMNADGSNQTRLTFDPASDHSPAWSPDGSKIAFVSNRSGNTCVWLMDVDGSNLVNVTYLLKTARWPAWSSDSLQLAFVSNNILYLAYLDGSGLKRAIDPKDLPTERLFVGWPNWAPDGSRLALISNLLASDDTGVSGTLYTINSDGRAFRPVESASGGPDESPSWSPGGEFIAYASYGESGERDILVIDMETHHITRLTSNDAMESFPAWEPIGFVPDTLKVGSIQKSQ